MIQKLRNNEYFGLQTTFDDLYNESKSGRYFTDLYRLSKYVAQKGYCGITGERLTPHQALCHHIKSTAQGGTDEYDNLIIINRKYHMLIHNSDPLRNKEYQKILSKFEIKAMNKLNRLRTEVGNPKLSL